MDVVVGGVARDDEADRRDMQAGRMVRVGVAELHDAQFAPFQLDYISLQLFRDHQVLGNLAWECRSPGSAEGLRRRILAHHLDRVGRRHDAGIWKPLEKGANATPMVSMAMSNV